MFNKHRSMHKTKKRVKEMGNRKWRALKVDILKQTIVTKCKKT